jgi:murein DD-endopeptidase MepM/ murein hydrolase activator NlpD
VAALVPMAFPPPAVAGRWQRPVPGEVTRTFSYSPAAPFVAGAHRGADFAARPGEPVRAACDGVVVHAGGSPGGRVVTLRCGGRRVTHLPLTRVTVRRGARVRSGARIGTVAPGHGGLHLGVRRAADPFGYEDPLALLPPPLSRRPAPPLAPVARPPALIARPGAAVAAGPAAIARPGPAAIARPGPAAIARPGPAVVQPVILTPPRGGPLRTAPPLAWAGLALVLLGAAGSGTLRVRRRPREPRVRARARAWRTG